MFFNKLHCDVWINRYTKPIPCFIRVFFNKIHGYILILEIQFNSQGLSGYFFNNIHSNIWIARYFIPFPRFIRVFFDKFQVRFGLLDICHSQGLSRCFSINSILIVGLSVIQCQFQGFQDAFHQFLVRFGFLIYSSNPKVCLVLFNIF